MQSQLTDRLNWIRCRALREQMEPLLQAGEAWLASHALGLRCAVAFGSNSVRYDMVRVRRKDTSRSHDTGPRVPSNVIGEFSGRRECAGGLQCGAAGNAMSSVAPEARRLLLTASFEGHATVLLLVQDSGRGIAVEDRERIFDRSLRQNPAAWEWGSLSVLL
jgi:hypothetical protein